MPYDPTNIYTAEPKLLSLSCFPTSLFKVVHPPSYDASLLTIVKPPSYEIMPGPRYQRISEESRGRVSLESSVGDEIPDSTLLLQDHMRVADHDHQAGQHKFTVHPTAILRLVAVSVHLLSFGLLCASKRPRNLSPEIVIPIAIARNVIVLSQEFSRHIRIRVEFRNGSITRGLIKPSAKLPAWLKSGYVSLLIDVVLMTALIITSIIATSGSSGWYYRRLAVPGCVLMHIAE